MTDRPIIFSASMAYSLWAGFKTQTRRLEDSPLARCEVGDRLWVREACRAEQLSRPPITRKTTPMERMLSKRTEVTIHDEDDGLCGIRYLADNHFQGIPNTEEAGNLWVDLYRYRDNLNVDLCGLTVPSTHMPRWASRMTLVVTEVRRQKLQDIWTRDAKAEGVQMSRDGQAWIVPAIAADFEETELYHSPLPEQSFSKLWDDLNSSPWGRWNDNPLVVALTFEVHKRNIDEMEKPK